MASIDTLRALPKDRARGTAIVDSTVSDKQLATMHEAGVRGARFNFQTRFNLVPDFADFHRQIARISEMGWIAKIFCGPEELEAVESEIRKTKITILFDHMGQLPFAQGINQPGMKRLLNFLREDRFWIMLSNGDHLAHDYPWDEAVPFGRAFYEAAPDRCIWGSDWPHVGRWIKNRPSPFVVHETGFGGKLALGLRYLPDQAAVQKVFVDNPSRLFGF
jgi:predicted TIM-barrel fold metal-dependent hydrolase